MYFFAFLFGTFFPEVSPGSSTPIVRCLFCCTVLTSPFLDKKALNLALKCTFQYTLPVLAAVVSKSLMIQNEFQQFGVRPWPMFDATSLILIWKLYQ